MSEESLVLMEHPFMSGEHVIARIVGQTKTMVTVIYWRHGRSEWSDEPKRRKAAGITRRLGSTSEIPDASIRTLSDHLRSLSDERDRRVREARAAYYGAISEIGVPS